MADDMDPNWTRADNVINGREKEMFAEHDKYLADPANYKSPVQSFTVFGDFIVDAAASIAYNKCERYLVIVENNGAIPNLPDDAMVEVPAYLRSWGPEPISQPAIPTFYKGLSKSRMPARSSPSTHITSIPTRRRSKPSRSTRPSLRLPSRAKSSTT